MKKLSLFNLFNPELSFSPIDPLDNGLREEIVAEQQEPDAIRLDGETADVADIGQFWHEVERDIHSGNGLEFSEE